MNLNEQRAKEADEAILKALSHGGGLTAREITERTGLGERRVYRALKRLIDKGLVQKRGSQFLRSYKAESNTTSSRAGITVEQLYKLLRQNFEIGLRDGFGGGLPENIDIQKEFHTFIAQKLGLPPILPPSWHPEVRMRAAVKAMSLAYTHGLDLGMSQWEAYKETEHNEHNCKSTTRSYVDFWSIIFGGADNSRVP